MVKYKLELKPIRSIGLDKMPEDKQKILHLALNLIAHTLNTHEKVSHASVMDDMSIKIEAEEEIEEEIKKLHKAAIITKLP